MMPGRPGSVCGVPVTPALVAACREVFAGVASRAAAQELRPLVAASRSWSPWWANARLVLGPPCDLCGRPAEPGHGCPTEDAQLDLFCSNEEALAEDAAQDERDRRRDDEEFLDPHTAAEQLDEEDDHAG